MKTLKLVVIGILLLFAGSAKAQISVHVNLGTPPQWGPSGYNDVRYYYLPDVEAYYDIPSSMFIYYNGVSWVHRSSLPGRYRNYDLYNGYKVPMSDYRGSRPYSNFRQHKTLYAKGYRGQEQHNIGNRPERGNFNEKNHSKGYSTKKGGHNNDRGRKENDKRNR
jgi:hypothetical protein